VARRGTIDKRPPERELVLARLASKWDLEKRIRTTMAARCRKPPLRREALDALRRLYRGDNDTEKLYDVLQRLHESSPNEAPITADLARLGSTSSEMSNAHMLSPKRRMIRAERSQLRRNLRVLSVSPGRNAEALALFKDCQQINYAIRTQRFTRHYCWRSQAKSTQQGITWPPRTTEFLRKKK
jgi:hypothetical protein